MRFIGTLEWAERHVVLNDVEFRAADYPWLHDIAATVDRVRGATFLLMFPPQVFKTLFLQLRLARSIAVEPVPSLWYAKTSEAVANLADEKLSRVLDAARPVQAKYPSDPDLRGNKRLHKFVDAPVSLLGADVREHRNSRSAQDLYLDEAWQYEPGAYPEIHARTDSYESTRRVIIGTTGPTADDDTDTLWQASTRHEWRCVCPTCHQRVRLHFGEPEDPDGLHWPSDPSTRETDGRWRTAVAAGLARWICGHCGTPHRYSPNLQRRMSDPALGARYEQTNPHPSPRLYGWHADAAVFRNWESLVEEWLKACNGKKLGDHTGVEEFTRKKKCRAWNPASLITARTDLPYGDYQLGDPWPEEGVDADGIPLRFGHVDVQLNHFWFLARSWSDKPATYGRSRLLHFEKVSSGNQLADIADRLKIPRGRIIVDSAYNPQLAYRLASEFGFKCANAIKCRDFPHRDGVRRIYDSGTLIDPFHGSIVQGGEKIVEFKYSSTGAKYRLHALRTSNDVNGKPFWTIPRNAPQEYIDQAWAEVLIKKRHPKSNGWYTEWKEIRADNHAFDMECQNVICATMLGLLGSDSLEPKAPEPENLRNQEVVPEYIHEALQRSVSAPLDRRMGQW